MTVSSSPTAPLVAVVGATGLQGGSVIAALEASDRPYRIRAFTRDARKAAAQKLAGRGVELVELSLAVENTAQVKAAFVGADFIFLMTNFWEHTEIHREIAEGKMLIDACASASPRGVIWSGLPSPSTISAGKYTKVYHFDGKAQITSYARTTHPSLPFVNVPSGLYMSNFTATAPGWRMIYPVPYVPGVYVLALPVSPQGRLPLIDVERDYGLWVRGVIEKDVFPAGADANTVSEWLSVENIANIISKGTGKRVVYKEVKMEKWIDMVVATGTPHFVAEDLAQSMRYFDEFGYYGKQPTAPLEDLARRPHTFREFVEKSDWKDVFPAGGLISRAIGVVLGGFMAFVIRQVPL
ncbi:NmrA domain-containing protein [Mycena chlorophos]|uniref:NmrA domain-containing protein n=1 Tax=Mycena chlorophos TaxID=658473 RepID=A0A8H6W324_MYCCL|nr:NmrA domain-containing protein [Mycena chlorophos]